MKEKCKKCLGSGIINNKVCQECESKGYIIVCDYCNNKIPEDTDIHVCNKCEKELKVVYKLRDDVSIEDIRYGKPYIGKIKSILNIGYLVSLNNYIQGLIKKKDIGNRKFNIGDEVIVYVKNINIQARKIDLLPIEIENFKVYEVKKDIERKYISEITPELIGNVVKISGIVTRVKDIGHAILFTLLDETGSIDCLLFKKDKFIIIEPDDYLTVIGPVSFKETLHVEARVIEKPKGREYLELRSSIEKYIDEKSKPEFKGFLSQNPVLEKLKGKILLAAKEIRKAVLSLTPIIVRHHADADGYIGGVSLEVAIVNLMKKIHPDIDEDHFFRRSPSRAPFYEMEDAVKDLHYSLEDMRKYGQKVPLVILVDNGSGREDIPGIKQLKFYGAKVIVIDHHYPGEVINGRALIDDYVDIHINPYLVGFDYNFPAGALAVEISRIINPEISDKIKHLAAFSFIADRANSKFLKDYMKIAKEKGYDEEYIKKIVECLDYEAYYLRFLDGRKIVEDLLGLGRLDRQRKMVEEIFKEVESAYKRQLEATLRNVKTATLKNGIVLNTIDLDMYSNKFDFPPAGKTTGLVHDVKVKENAGKPVITIGFARDFAIIRATEELKTIYGFNLNKMIEELRNELPHACIDGGGHEVAGSLKFVEGYRKEVLEKLAFKIASLRKLSSEDKIRT